MEILKYTLPAHWASYLVNDDSSGLEPGEVAEIDTYLSKERIRVLCTSDDSEPWLAYENDFNDLGGNVLEFDCEPLP